MGKLSEKSAAALPLSPEELMPRVRMANYFKVHDERVWGPRRIVDYELILIVAGEFSYKGGGADCFVRDGDVLCISPGDEHVFRFERSFSYGAVISCIHFELGSVSGLAGEYCLNPAPPLLTQMANDQSIHQLFRHCRNVFESMSRYREELLSTIVREILLRLAEYWHGTATQRLSPRMRKMLDYLYDEVDKVPGRRELSREFGLSPEHINAIFKREMGSSPGAVVRRLRMQQACRYLQEDGLSVKETADRLGFCDEFYFSRLFKQEFGCPPANFKSV